MAEDTYQDEQKRRREIADAIKTLAASSDPSHQRKAVQLSEILRNMQERRTAEAVASGDIPSTPPSMEERIAESSVDPLEKSLQETGSILGEPYIDRSFWQKAQDVGKQLTEPQMFGDIVSLAATPLSIAAYAAQAHPLTSKAGLIGSSLRALSPWSRAAVSIGAPVLTGAAAREAAIDFPWNTDTTHEWGKLSGSLLPWKSGTGTAGAVERLAKLEAVGHQVGPVIKTTTDLGRYLLMGGGNVRQRASDVLARYDAVGLRDVAPSYAASRLGFVQALGPGLLKWPGVRGGVLRQYEKAMEGTKGFLLGKLKAMSPATFGAGEEAVSMSMYKGAMEYGIKTIKAIDKLYDEAFTAARSLYGDAPVVNLRPFLDVVDEIRGGGLRTMVRQADGTRRALRSPPPEKINKWIEGELALLESRTTVDGIKDLQHAVRKQLDSLSPGDEGFKELTRLNGALTGSMRNFFKNQSGMVPKSGTWAEVTAEQAANVARLFQKADSTNRRFWLSSRTPAARSLTGIEGSFWERRFLTPKSGQRYMELGSRDVGTFYDIAFRNRNPGYLKNLEEIIGPKAYRMASQRWLNDAYDAALKEGKVLDVDSFLRATKLDTQPQIAAAALRGSGVEVSQLKALGEILRDFPIDPKLQQMLVRRIGLAGGTSALKIGAAGSLLGAASGGGVLGIGFMGIILALGATRRLGTILSRPKLMEALVEYGKLDTKTLRTKALRRQRINAALKLARILNNAFPNDPIDLSQITDVTSPVQRWISPVDLRGGLKWTGWSGPGANIEDLIY